VSSNNFFIKRPNWPAKDFDLFIEIEGEVVGFAQKV
jgi:hypothetical protein